MQIRLGNRQDEPAITSLVFEVMEEFGLKPKPDRAESDLRNIVENYFGHDGLFLVAEEGKELAGIAGARKSNSGELELVRLAVSRKWRGKGVARSLMHQVIDFARNMGYQKIEVEPARQYPGEQKALRAWGFTSANSEDAQPIWFLNIQPVG